MIIIQFSLRKQMCSFHDHKKKIDAKRVKRNRPRVQRRLITDLYIQLKMCNVTKICGDIK